MRFILLFRVLFLNKVIPLPYEINHTSINMDIKGIIKKKGYTLERVAKEMGITRVTLSQNLANNKTPSLTTLQRIAKVIGCSVGEFFLDEVKPPQFTALVRVGSDTLAFDEFEELKKWVNGQEKAKKIDHSR